MIVLCVKSPFLLSHDLKRHNMTHSEDKGYDCSQFGKSFSDSGSLKKHQRSHTQIQVACRNTRLLTAGRRDTIVMNVKSPSHMLEP